MNPPTPHTFRSQTHVVYVCYGPDPTYAAVKKPEFHIISSFITRTTQDAMFMLDHNKNHSSECNPSDFESRTANPKDQARITEIIAYMAHREGTKFLAWGKPNFSWLKGSSSDLNRHLFTKVGEQFTTGDYHIIHDAVTAVA